MTYNRIIEMINEYLEEPHSIDKEWVEALFLCAIPYALKGDWWICFYWIFASALNICVTFKN